MEPVQLTVIQINGPINSGKSTLGRLLAHLLHDAYFIDGDDYDAPDDMPKSTKWALALTRIEQHIADANCSYMVVAYPIVFAGFEQLKSACERRSARFLVVTLSPPLEIALADRGERRLTPAERQRILEMYREGYQLQSFSDLFLDTSRMTPLEGAQQIAAFINSPSQRIEPNGKEG